MTAPTVALTLAAGAVGALARYLVTAAVQRSGRPGGAATLAVNVVGSLALGALVGASPRLSPALLAIAGTGFLGAFTTFATFAVQSVQRASVGWRRAAGSVAVMAVCCAAAAAAGTAATRVVWP